jgi:hypothetical protein
MLVYFVATWSNLRPLGIFCVHLVYFMVIWYIFPRFGMLYQEKSGNLVLKMTLKPIYKHLVGKMLI